MRLPLNQRGRCGVGMLALLLCAVGVIQAVCAQEAGPAREKVVEAMHRGAKFFREQVASHGGYAYYASGDLKRRWGEGEVAVDTVVVQPPGSPTVGMAYLKAYAATNDAYFLEGAREAGKALVGGQLQSGGWTQVIHFGKPLSGDLGKYRKRAGGSRNNSSLDDDQTQSALRFLMRLDEAEGFKNEEVHEAVLYGLEALLKAQFPCGAFPQVWQEPVKGHPVMAARYPEYDWKTEGRVKDYWNYYTLNDNLAGTVFETLRVAEEVYKEARFREAIVRLGDFLILAQMPEPQPAWCQQYSYEMVPIWARKFEPPAITAWESQDVMRTLIHIAEHTGDKKYLAPIPKGLNFLEKHVLSDGKVARYYELRTSKPLYMDGEYQLTYDDSQAPSHYGWKQGNKLSEIRKAWEAAMRSDEKKKPVTKKVSRKGVELALQSQDKDGRWVSTFAGESLVGKPRLEKGAEYISSEVFSRNLELLSEYLVEMGQQK